MFPKWMRAADDSKRNMYCIGNLQAFGYGTEVQYKIASLKKPAGSHAYFCFGHFLGQN